MLDVYTPCQPEHGIGDDAARRQARLAVESRMSPVFVHDPRQPAANIVSLEGNPSKDKDWTNTTLNYVDEDGAPSSCRFRFTPADFALTRRPLQEALQASGGRRHDGVPVHEYLEAERGRAGGQDAVHLVHRRRTSG